MNVGQGAKDHPMVDHVVKELSSLDHVSQNNILQATIRKIIDIREDEIDISKTKTIDLQNHLDSLKAAIDLLRNSKSSQME